MLSFLGDLMQNVRFHNNSQCIWSEGTAFGLHSVNTDNNFCPDRGRDRKLTI